MSMRDKADIRKVFGRAGARAGKIWARGRKPTRPLIQREHMSDWERVRPAHIFPARAPALPKTFRIEADLVQV